MELKTITIKDGITLHIWPIKQFKTISLFFNFLGRVDATKTSALALLSEVMCKGTKDYPNEDSLANQKEKLYAAEVASLTGINGEYHSFLFYFSFIDERYLVSEDKLLDKELKLIESYLLNPLVDRKGFKADFFANWQKMYYQSLLVRENNKETYAAIHLKELLDKNHPMSYYVRGKAEEILSITPAQLNEVYQEVLNRELNIYVVGDVEEDKIVGWCKKTFAATKHIHQQAVVPLEFNKPICLVEEKKAFNQSYLTMLYTLPYYFDKGRIEAGIFSLIFGGSASSKLFKNVREKYGLCYSINASYASDYGAIIVNCGIDAKNYEKAVEVINEQLNEMVAGHIEEEEITIAKTLLLSGNDQAFDSAYGIFSTYNHFALHEMSFDKEKYIDDVMSVTLDQIKKVAEQVKLQITYLVKQGGRK